MRKTQFNHSLHLGRWRLSRPCARWLAWLPALWLVLWTGSAFSSEPTNQPPQILFLHLKMQDQAISLVATNLRPGAVKPGPEGDATDLFFELVSSSGDTLWKGALSDPTVRHLEYEDPANPGRLRRKQVKVNEAEFVVRVPFSPAARHVDFFKLEPSEPGAAQTRLLRKPLGRVLLATNPAPSK